MALRYEIIGSYSKMMEAQLDKLARVATQTMRSVQNTVKTEGRSAISAGIHSSRLANAFRVNLYPYSGDSINPVVFAYHKVPWAGQFEDPQPISGFRWLPIEANLPGGKRWTPHDFANQIGPLRRGVAGSKPVLFGEVRVANSGRVLRLPSKRGNTGNTSFSRQQKKWLPVFVGISSITDPKRYDITAVVNKASEQIDALYAKAWEEDSERG
jgi:hypothetical protein